MARFRVDWVCWLALVACGSALKEPEPLARDLQTDEFEEVPYPPPAAFVELVPPSPNPRAVWVDGHWTFRRGGYVWDRGGWVLPPDGATYAQFQILFEEDGRILFAPSGWYDPRGRRLPDPKALAPASIPPNELTSEEQQSGQP